MSQISQSSEILGIANSTNQKTSSFFSHFLHLFLSSFMLSTDIFVQLSSQMRPNGTEEYLPIYIYHQWLSQNVGKHSIQWSIWAWDGVFIVFCPNSRFSGNFSNCKSWNIGILSVSWRFPLAAFRQSTPLIKPYEKQFPVDLFSFFSRGSWIMGDTLRQINEAIPTNSASPCFGSCFSLLLKLRFA